MNEARRATAADAAELVRLRGVLMTDLARHEGAGDGWQEAADATLRERLAEPHPTLIAFVVDQPDQPDRPDRPSEPERPSLLAACAVGTVERRLPGPVNPSGEIGYVFNVATDPAHRRRGYSRSCMTALLAWYRDRGIGTIDLLASPEGEPLYRSLGFVRSADSAMRLRV
ncbi:GNAT family N-acetyltransferase [Nonomuraea sp. NEAU-A123]|uniref:GNAT family N-acetyltransferase n=1 Tax=Nonomuraea sp. NEAU-A123 TaxID=2839649 RepID=UPI001BE4BA32|nr:GNAT family N-acetyltransferase [Nonomuraea sp. NEAU-A123]MBT2232431.1 GNAT family N-acetyltransferase [Nonomuraea sp. NEAU-A123]